MGSGNGIGLADVQAVYNGPEGDLWELIMGHQIHIGGFKSSMDLAEKAGIAEGTNGVDLCCCNGAGMRFLVRYYGARQLSPNIRQQAREIERLARRWEDHERQRIRMNGLFEQWNHELEAETARQDADAAATGAASPGAPT